MKKATRFLALVLALVLAFALCACGGTGSGSAGGDSQATTAAPAGDDNSGNAGNNSGAAENTAVLEKLTYGQKTGNWDVSPWMNNGSGGGTIYTLLYSFVMSSPFLGALLDEMEYDMAESYEFNDDKTECTVKLKDYIHDIYGNAIKAEDVVFCYKTSPEVSGTHAALNNYIADVEAVDDLTVKFTAKAYAPGTWEYILSNCEIVSKEWYEGSSEEDRSMRPAATGAYYVKENTPGTSTVFAAVDDFWNADNRTFLQNVNVKEIYFMGMPEDTMRSIALDNKEIDLTRLENVTTVPYMSDDNYVVFEVPSSTADTINFNMTAGSPWAEDVNLRKAILTAIDFKSAQIAAVGEFGVQPHDITAPAQNGYNKEWDSEDYFDYNVDKAKEYLAASDYDENSGLELRLLCKATDPQKAAAVVIQDNLSELGISLVIDAYDQNLLDTYTADPTAWDLVWLSPDMFTGIINEPWNYFYGQNAATGSTITFIKDDELQKKLDALQNDFSDANIEAFHDYEVEMAYGAGMYNPMYYATCQKGITSIGYNPTGNISLNNVVFAADYVPVN